MKKLLILMIFTVFGGILLNPTTAKADHLMGSDIAWTCLGTDTYVVTVTIYRDCNGISMPDDVFTLTCGTKTSVTTTMSTTRSKGLDITPVCKKSCSKCGKVVNTNYGDPKCKFPYGIELYTFTAKVIFSKLGNSWKGCCAVNISWTSCCRSGTLTAGGNWQSFYVQGTMNRCVKPCASSPVFTNPPIAIICQNQCFSYNPGMNDNNTNPDGSSDSLVYSIVKPCASSSTGYVTYNSPYTYDKPLKFDSFPKKNALWNPPSCAGFHLDSATGDLQFKPTKVEQTVMAIQVQMWGVDANGKKILKGTTRRDVQLIVMACPNNHVPTLSGIDGTNSNDADFCVNQLSCFTINSGDPDTKDTVSVNWNPKNLLVALGATFTVEKNKQHPRSTFCWKPGPSSAKKTYQFIVLAQDDACPLNGRTQRSFRIHVHPAPEGQVTAVDSGCGNWYFTLTPKAGSTFTPSTVSWSGDDRLGGKTLSIKHHYRGSGSLSGDSFKYQVSFAQNYSSAVGVKSCPTVITGSIYVPPYVNIKLPNDSHVCKTDTPTIYIGSTSKGGTTPYKFLWSNGATTKGIYAKITRDSTIYCTITDNNGSGCQNFDTIHIKAVTPPKPGLGLPQRHCAGETVILKDTSTHDSMGYSWFNIKNKKLSLSDSSTCTVTDSGIYKCRIADPQIASCYNSDSIRVDFNQPVTVVPQNVTACGGYPVSVDAGLGKGDSNATWIWRDLYNTSTIYFKGRKIKFNPTKDFHFLVTSSQTYKGVTCGDTDTINVKISPAPTIKTSKIPDQCYNNPPVDLSQYTTTPGGLWYVPNTPKAIASGNFYPDSAGLGPHILIYKMTDATTGCMDSLIQKVIVDTLPTVLLKADTFQCIDAPTAFDLSSLVIAPAGGIWKGPAVSNNKFYQADPQAGGDGVKKFTYLYTNKVKSSHCQGSADVNITVYRSLKPYAGPDIQTCKKYSVPVALYGNLPDYNPRWFIDPASNTPSSALQVTGGQYTFDPTKAAEDTVHLIFQVSHPGNRCPKNDTVAVIVHQNPAVSITPINPLCVTGSPVKLDGLPKGGNFTLVDAGINPSALSSPYFYPDKAGPGRWAVKYSYTDNNQCFDSLTTFIIVNDTPSVHILDHSPACVGQPVTAHAQYGNGVKGLTWYSDDPSGKFLLNSDSAKYVGGTNPSFWLKVRPQTVSPFTTCPWPNDSTFITLNPLPVASFSGTPLMGCSPLTPQFQSTSTVAGGLIVGYDWDFGDNSNSTDPKPLHTYKKDSTATYTVSLRVTSDAGCIANVNYPNYVQVYATPRPWFDANPFYTTISLPEITFSDSTTIKDPKLTRGDLMHRWDFGDGQTSTTRLGNFTHSYGDTGLYTVKLWVRNPQYNCEAETIRVNYIDIRPELIVFIPNAFTPNKLYNEKTIVNEKFMPVVSNYSSYHLWVYSRWGELMYETTIQKEGWDGYYKGQTCQEGVYIYRLEATSLEGKKYKYSGTITLLR